MYKSFSFLRASCTCECSGSLFPNCCHTIQTSKVTLLCKIRSKRGEGMGNLIGCCCRKWGRMLPSSGKSWAHQSVCAIKFKLPKESWNPKACMANNLVGCISVPSTPLCDAELPSPICPACKLAPPSHDHLALYKSRDESRWACLWNSNPGFHSCVRTMPHGWHMLILWPTQASRTCLSSRSQQHLPILYLHMFPFSNCGEVAVSAVSFLRQSSSEGLAFLGRCQENPNDPLRSLKHRVTGQLETGAVRTGLYWNFLPNDPVSRVMVFSGSNNPSFLTKRAEFTELTAAWTRSFSTGLYFSF